MEDNDLEDFDTYEPEYVGLPRIEEHEDVKAEEYNNVDPRLVVQQLGMRLRQTALP